MIVHAEAEYVYEYVYGLCTHMHAAYGQKYFASVLSRPHLHASISSDSNYNVPMI